MEYELLTEDGSITALVNTYLYDKVDREYRDLIQTQKRIYESAPTAELPLRPTGDDIRAQRNSAIAIEKLILDVVGQSLAVVDFTGDETVAKRYQKYWDVNKCSLIEDPLYRSAALTGVSWVSVTRGTIDGKPSPVIRFYSSGEVYAHFEDAKNDVTPQYVVERAKTIDGTRRCRVYTEEFIHTYVDRGDDRGFVWVSTEEHGMGTNPFVRFYYQMDSLGGYIGEINPVKSTIDRIVQTNFDTEKVRLIGAYKKLWAIMDPPAEVLKKGESAVNAWYKQAFIRVGIDEALIGSGNTQFGQLDGTPLDGYIALRNDLFKELSMLLQFPLGLLNSDLVNVGSDVVEVTYDNMASKMNLRQKQFGHAWLLVMWLCDIASGINSITYDVDTAWREIRREDMSKMTDAFQKLVASKIPLDEALEILTFFTPSQIANIRKSTAWKNAVKSQEQLLSPEAQNTVPSSDNSDDDTQSAPEIPQPTNQ